MNLARVPLTESSATPIVYVVDDDVSVRESLKALIHCTTWQIETFESAGEFLACPRPFAPCCLVLDISLPDLNGLDLHKHIATDFVDLPVVFMTGHSEVPMTVQAMNGGAAEFLMKPFGADVLLNAIQRALKRSEAASKETPHSENSAGECGADESLTRICSCGLGNAPALEDCRSL